MILSILLYGCPILNEKAEQVTVFDEDLKQLAENMIETMHAAKGAGLASNQVGDKRSVIVVKHFWDEECFVMVNPEVIEHQDVCPCWICRNRGIRNNTARMEGCLSIPGLEMPVIRPQTITLRYQDLIGKVIEDELFDMLARVVCHEVDHVKGITIVDKQNKYQQLKLFKKLEQIQNGEITPPNYSHRFNSSQ